MGDQFDDLRRAAKKYDLPKLEEYLNTPEALASLGATSQRSRWLRNPLLAVYFAVLMLFPVLYVGSDAISSLRVGSATPAHAYSGSEEAWPGGPPPGETGMATYYVSPSGSDSNSGTISAPFLTLTKARDTVRTRIATSMSGDVTVYLRGGVYRQTSTLALTSQDSGKSGFNVLWKAYPGERPVVSGGVPVTGWTLHDAGKNIWKSTVGTGLVTRDFAINGKKAIKARTSGDFPSGYSVGSSSITAPSALGVGSWGNKNKVEAVSWTDSHFYSCRASGISGNTITMVNPCWGEVHNTSDQPFDSVGYLANAYELLDAEGEWYDDETAGVLYYKPRTGETLTSSTVGYAGGLTTVISGTSVSNVQFSGLTFAHSGFNDPSTSTGYAGYQQGHYPTPDGGDRMPPAALAFTGSKSIVFDHNVVEFTAAVGMSFDLGSQGNTITANVFDTIGNNAINLGNFDNETPATNLETRNFTIANNYFHNMGDDLYNSAAIWGGYVADIRIDHNEIYHTPQKGIAIGWGWGTDSYARDNKIRYNFIHETTVKLQDSGAMYALSSMPNTEYAWNYVFNDVNRSNCLYPDEGSANQSWHDNVCSQVGQWLHIWIDTIHDLTVSNNCADTTTNENQGQNITMSGNTFISSGGTWPSRCQNIINGAGIEAAYQAIKTTSLV